MLKLGENIPSLINIVCFPLKTEPAQEIRSLRRTLTLSWVDPDVRLIFEHRQTQITAAFGGKSKNGQAESNDSWRCGPL